MSATTREAEIDLAGVNGDASAAARGIPHGGELMAFAQALARRDAGGLAATRAALLAAAGPAVLVDAAGVAANFQRMVRIADSIGIPVDEFSREMSRQVRAELDLGRFASAQNSQL